MAHLRDTSALTRRIAYIPDTQVKPGVPLDHIDWVAQALVDYKPNVVVVGGDFWDFPSLNTHSKPGSLDLEGTRFDDDLQTGNEAFARLCLPMEKEQAKLAKRGQKWNVQKVFTEGNHENRVTRTVSADPKWKGIINTALCDVRDFAWYPFLERVWIDGICFSHYFQSSHSHFAIGGSIDNRLNKIGASFVQGHEQGFRYGNRIMASGRTLHGLVAGSCYTQEESYRGAQGQRHWRGIVMLNGVKDGEYDLMNLSLDYLCRKYEGKHLVDYMTKAYKKQEWRHLA